MPNDALVLTVLQGGWAGEVAAWREKYEKAAFDLEAIKVCPAAAPIGVQSLIISRNQLLTLTQRVKRHRRRW